VHVNKASNNPLEGESIKNYVGTQH